MPESLIQRSFAAGEVAPALSTRADLPRYLAGLKSCRNFIVRRHGGVTKRSGTAFLYAVKDRTVSPRLIPFIFEGNDQTYVIECGAGYFRFYWHGEIVLASVGGPVYEVANPYPAGDLQGLQFTQSTDTLTITHVNHQPRELQRYAHTDWRLQLFITSPWAPAPTGLTVTAGDAAEKTRHYQATAIKTETYEETYPSPSVALVSCSTGTEELPNVIVVDPVDGAGEYNIFRDDAGNGVFGYIGTTTTGTFRDIGFVPDYTITPPLPREMFDDAGEFPSCCAYHKQRLMFANTNQNPETIEGSQVGGYHNFSRSTPLQDDDAVACVLASNELNPVRHLISLKRLLVFTDRGEWIIAGGDGGSITPTEFNAEQFGWVGANDVRPVVVNGDVLYVQGRGTDVRALKFSTEAGGFTSLDLTVFAGHLFDGYRIVDLAFQLQPHSVIWAVRSDGVLLGLTYLPEMDTYGWHRHDTDGVVERVCVVPDRTAVEDVVYLVVRRTIGGVEQRYVERLRPSFYLGVTPVADAFFVDCGLTYDGTPITTITGLGHLEGKRLAILADGAVVSDGITGPAFVVSGGAVELGRTATTVRAGLPYIGHLETLDLDVQGTVVRDKRKRVQGLTVVVEGSPHGFKAGLDVDHLVAEQAEPWVVTRTELVTAPLDVNITTTWEPAGRIVIEHTAPLPFAVNAVIPNLDLGG